MSDLKSWEARYGNAICEMRRSIHRFPEISMKESRTTDKIKLWLEEAGADIVDIGINTGAVAVIKGAMPGPAICVRADIDAIRQTEKSGLSFESEIPGVMHACGHDIHSAAALGASMILNGLRHEMRGDAVFVFQPAEELLLGAGYVLERGLLEAFKLSAMFGLHNYPELTVGKIGVKRGALMAAKADFTLTIKGVGGHGGKPHMAVDPIVAAAGVINAIQSIISRNTDPMQPAVVSVCSIHAGTPENLIVDKVCMTGSIRALSQQVQALAKDRLASIADMTARAYGCCAELNINDVTPALINGDFMYNIARTVAEELVGKENVVEPEPTLASEDFAVYAERIPSFFYFVGSGTPGRPNPPWHNEGFRGDERTAVVGAALLARSVLAAQGAYFEGCLPENDWGYAR